MHLLSRRASIDLCCFAIASTLIPGPGRSARGQNVERFAFCGTRDDIATSNELQLTPYNSSAGEAQLQPLPGTATGLSPYGMACVADRWTITDGLTKAGPLITLGVCFLDGDAEKRALVKSIAEEWLQGGLESKLRFQWDVPPPQAQIRISFSRGVLDRSQIGRQATAIRSSAQETMNLHHYMVHSVVRHEFGHALGLRHEHQHPDLPVIWNPKAVFEYFRSKGWSDDQIRHNVLDVAPRRFTCVGDPAPNPQSVMSYYIQEGWANQIIFPSEEITARDRACVLGIYNAA